ncbi:carbohydrate-binding protein [Collinsella aerofaciens]|uniref:carbohydrate-binding protein n=1 Tax=Collinsella aerofaciens TaxID=74426 RepID=UPI00359C61E3
MFYGQFVSGAVYLTTDGSGLPIHEAAEPSPGAGYHTSLAYEQHDGAIWQVWTLVPDAGTPQDAALMLAQIQAAALSDDDALKVPALFQLYEQGHVYAQGDRVLWQGVLYKAISGHTATSTDPSFDPRHWSKVVPSTGVGEEVAEWVSGKTYAKGDRVTKYGSVYESLVDGNTLEPGSFGSDGAWAIVAGSN